MKTLLIAVTFYPMWNFDIPRLREDHKNMNFECFKCPTKKMVTYGGSTTTYNLKGLTTPTINRYD